MSLNESVHVSYRSMKRVIKAADRCSHYDGPECRAFHLLCHFEVLLGTVHVHLIIIHLLSSRTVKVQRLERHKNAYWIDIDMDS
jgi:hypothetical protein